MFERTLNKKEARYPHRGHANSFVMQLFDVIQQYSNRKPTLVFNNTRKSAQDAAKVTP